MASLMGKTLGKILEFASIAVLGVVTAGVGIGVAAGLSVATALASVSVLGISSSILGSIAIAGLSAVASILGQPKSARAESSETAQKAPLPPRVGAYGRGGLFGAYVFYQTDPNFGVAGDIFAIHDNPWAPIDGVEGFYLGDDRVANDRGVIAGLPDGTYTAGKVEIDYRVGARTETPFSQIVNLFTSWDSSHRGDGVCTGMVTWQPVKTANYNQIYPKGQPPLRMIARWSKVYDWRDGSQSLTDPLTWKWSENAVLHDMHYRLIREGQQPTLPINDPGYAAQLASILQTKWNALFAPTVAYWTAAANDADSPMGVPSFRTLVGADDTPDGDHTLVVSEITGLAVGMQIVISALDNINHTETRTVTSISGKGPAGYTLGLDSEVAYFHGQGSAVYWIATDAHPINEPRYRSCVAHKLTDPHKDTKAAITACYDGWVAPREDGALVCYSGRYYTPTVTIGPDEIVSHSFEDGINDEDAVNQIVLTYISTEHNYFAVDCTPWEDDDDIASRGRIASQPLQNQVPSYTQARRLGKRMMARVMAPYRGSITTNAYGRIAIGQRFVHLTISEGGATWYDGPAEITGLTYNLPTGGVTFSWVSADPNVDAWDPSTEAGDPAPVGNQVKPQPVATPTITSAVADYSSISDDGTGVRVDITAAGLNRDDVTWSARWRISGAAVWNEQQYGDVDPGTAVQLVTSFVPTGQTVEVQVAYQIADGRYSDYSASTLVDTATDQTAPDAATAISVVSWSDSLELSTDQIARASSYRWRFYKADGTTLMRTIVTASRTVSYTSPQAVTDGIQRSYVVTVAGVNAAGAGTEANSGVITNAPPSLVTGFSATGGASNAEIDFTLLTEADVAGYAIYVSTVSGFDPLTQGSVYTSLGSPAYIQNLAAGTFYVKMAAFDAWSDYPGYLNITSQTSFAITTGGGGTGGGGGGGGGGYCVTIDIPILLADGTTKPAGDLVVGDIVHTQHEDTMIWGDFPVQAIQIVDSTDVWHADIGPAGLDATGDHRVWISGWVHMRDIGVKAADAKVAMITITDAHTYVSAGVLSHNLKVDPT
jgi:hypothetical protein